VVGPPLSPRTETPRSQRYSQRVSNQTKRNHDSISTSPIPLPQTTAITCLSDPAPTLSQDKQAKHARHTQDTLPGTRKRTRSQTESQQHTPLTKILDIVALNSQIVIQPTTTYKQSANNLQTVSQTNAPHARIYATKLSLLPPSKSISTTQPLRLQTTQHHHHSADSKGKEDVRSSIYPTVFLA